MNSGSGMQQHTKDALINWCVQQNVHKVATGHHNITFSQKQKCLMFFAGTSLVKFQSNDLLISI